MDGMVAVAAYRVVGAEEVAGWVAREDLGWCVVGEVAVATMAAERRRR